VVDVIRERIEEEEHGPSGSAVELATCPAPGLLRDEEEEDEAESRRRTPKSRTRRTRTTRTMRTTSRRSGWAGAVIEQPGSGPKSGRDQSRVASLISS
jgi:hypothetical protein